MPPAANASVVPEADRFGALAERQLRLGLEYCGAGRVGLAIAAFQSGTAPALAAPAAESIEALSALHAELAEIAMHRGDFELADANFRVALKLAPHLTDCWCSFGDMQLKAGNYL
jgi:Tfp pilus assembly protein PilF